MPKNKGSVISALQTALCKILQVALTPVSNHLFSKKRLFYTLLFLLTYVNVSAQRLWYSTEPARMYFTIDPVNNYHLDKTFATWPYTLFGPKFVATPIHQEPTEWLYYMDTIVVNPPWMIYEVYDYSTYIYLTTPLEYIDEIYPVTQEVLNARTMGLGVPYYALDNYHTNTGMRTDDPINIQFYYLMVPPWKLKNFTGVRSICANERIDLVSIGDNVTNPQDNEYYQGSYVLEYNVGPDLTTGWKAIDSSAGRLGYGFSITPSQLIPEVANAKRNVWFRHRQKAVYNNGATVLYSRWSEPSDPFEISPAPPTVDAAQIVKTAGCFNEGGGTISIPGSAIHTGYSTIRWTLRKGIVSTPCDPDLSNPSSDCGDLLVQSNGAVPVSGGIYIDNVPKGTYTLWVFNPGETTGSCMTPYYLTVDEYTPLTAVEDANLHKNISCYGGSDGAISVTAGGADTNADYYFELRSGSTIVRAEQTGTNKSILWENLPAGTYQAIVRNAKCTNSAPPVNIVLQQPSQVSGNLVGNDPTCTSPGNGAISIAAATTGNYEFQLYQNGSIVKTSGVQNNTNAYTFSDLPGGTYRAVIVNSDAPLCTGWDSTVTLQALSPLGITLTSSDSVSCFGGNDGRLQFTAKGGTGQYQYTLNGIANTTGLFTGLSAGAYTVTVTNQGNTCSDAVTLDATVYQRAALRVQLQQTPLSCYPNTDGVIESVVTGGSGSYSYDWQQLKNGVWTSGFWFSTDTRIDALSAGTYRVIITDRNAPACSVTSAESTIAPVNELMISKVTVHDAVCLADGGHIDMTAAGGSGNYIYEWSLDGNTYHPFVASTNLTTAGNYQLRVSDDHGCRISADRTYAITLPSLPLSFSTVYSDYNGYNVSCKGNDNGYVRITATGGNGGSYSGYSYALDNGAYSTASLIEHITGGIHQLHVRDGRGCISTQQILMTEPASTLGLRVSEKEHPGCGADPVGHITVVSEGGSAPYTYAIDNGAWQDSPSFTGLAAGDHSLQVRDAGGCTTEITTTLTAAYTPLVTTADITDVKCAGQSNGAINLHTSGGDGNYTYQWSTPSLSGSTAGNIPSGNYTIHITDSKGCKQEVTYTVHQPDQLALALEASSICDGAGDGSINAVVKGGTTPYRYSLDQGSWLNAGSFKGLSEGKYHIAVQDAHGCEISGDATISKSNIKPAINFLVASRRNAFDTLVIKDISLPEPDNITWSYDPKAVLLGYDNGTPLIKFTDPGTYWVEMVATFGQCSYTLRKELEIAAYDPSAGPVYTVPVQVIDTVTLSPNPNNGHFTYNIKLNRKQQMIVYVYDINGVIAEKRQYAPALEVNDSFTISGTATGVFILRVITQNESRDVRFIISR